jgi:hypothetical protein
METRGSVLGSQLERIHTPRKLLLEEEHYNEPFGWVYPDKYYPFTEIHYDKVVVTPEVVAVQRRRAYEGVVIAVDADPLQVESMYEQGVCERYSGQLEPGHCYVGRYSQEPNIRTILNALSPDLIFVKLVYTRKDQPYYNNFLGMHTPRRSAPSASSPR